MATSQTRRRRRPSRIEELIAVAARLFVERGYDTTSMQEIADEMGILKGSVYHYVRTKEDLLWIIVEPRLMSLVDYAEATLGDDSVPVLDRIRAGTVAHTERFETDYPYMMVITRENGDTITAERRERMIALRNSYYQLWKRVVAEGVRNGDLRSDLDPTVTVEAIFGMLNGMSRWFHPEGAMPATSIGEAFADMIVRGIERGSPVDP